MCSTAVLIPMWRMLPQVWWFMIKIPITQLSPILIMKVMWFLEDFMVPILNTISRLSWFLWWIQLLPPRTRVQSSPLWSPWLICWLTTICMMLSWSPLKMWLLPMVSLATTAPPLPKVTIPWPCTSVSPWIPLWLRVLWPMWQASPQNTIMLYRFIPVTILTCPLLLSRACRRWPLHSMVSSSLHSTLCRWLSTFRTSLWERMVYWSWKARCLRPWECNLQCIWMISCWLRSWRRLSRRFPLVRIRLPLLWWIWPRLLWLLPFPNPLLLR